MMHRIRQRISGCCLFGLKVKDGVYSLVLDVWMCRLGQVTGTQPAEDISAPPCDSRHITES